MNNPLPQQKNKIFSVALAFVGAISSIPLAGLHKFYLGQPLWGILYFIISWQNPMARIACAIDIILYLSQNQEQFNQKFNPHLITTHSQPPAKQIIATANALRELEQLRQEGLISEYEFEQKRRQLLS